MITDAQKILLGILSAGLFDAPMPDLRNVDWEQLFDEAGKQAVFPLTFAVVGEEAEKVLPAEWFRKLQNQFFQSHSLAAKNDYYHGELHRLLSGNGIPYVIIKGQASAEYYPEPYLRAAGDVDFLVSKEDLERAEKALEGEGFRKMPDPEHECHWVFCRDEITAEMHWEPNGIPEGEKGTLCRVYLLDCISKARLSSGEEGYCLPDAFHHGVILLLHIAVHLVNTGIGLRHLCDWAVFVAHFDGKDFEDFFREKLMDVGLWRFAQLLTALSVKYLGLSEQGWARGVAEPEFLEEMMGDLLAGGNFGCKDPERINDAKLYITNGRMKGNMLAQIAASMTQKAKVAIPACRRIPLLLPIGWAYVGVRHLARIQRGERPRIHVKKMVQGAAARREIYREFRLFE